MTLCMPNAVSRQRALLLLMLACVSLCTRAAEPSTTPTNTATMLAQNLLVKTYTFPDFQILQFKLEALSQYSYVLISDKKALVIDPIRDPVPYQKAVASQGATIKGIFLTHTHADFVAGHLELATRTTSPIYQSTASGAEYPFQGVAHNQQLPFGAVTLQFLETPGHTPDCVSLAVLRESKQNVPEVVFTGDTLFAGSMGRPELLNAVFSIAELASKAFDAWDAVLSKLPNEVMVLPTHGAGPFRGQELRDDLFSTIGDERKTNPYAQLRGRNLLISAMLERLPPQPQHYTAIARMNRQGPPTINWAAPLPPKVFSKAPSLNQVDSVYLIDVRTEEEYAKGHIPNAINIGLHDRFEAWTGALIPWGTTLILCGSESETEAAVKRLHRIGYTVQGTIRFDETLVSQLLLTTNQRLSPQVLSKRIQERAAPITIDIRDPQEWLQQRISTVINLPLEQLNELATVKLNRNDPVIIVCKTDYRSSMAIGILERKGFKNVMTLLGGIDAWIHAGLPVIQMQNTGSVTQQKRAKQKVKLPDAIDPIALHRLMLDQTYPVELVDIRPEEQFADYSLPGARNIPFDELLADPVLLNGKTPLILLDRDGYLAMAIGGILVQKTERPVRVLYGGLNAYWEFATSSAPGETLRQPAPDKTKPSSGSTPEPNQPPSQSKKRNAGC